MRLIPLQKGFQIDNTWHVNSFYEQRRRKNANIRPRGGQPGRVVKFVYIVNQERGFECLQIVI